jgi:hypothetical protein
MADRCVRRDAPFFVALEVTADKGRRAASIDTQRLTLLVALLRDFGAVQQMPSVAKRARCLAAGLPARPA